MRTRRSSALWPQAGAPVPRRLHGCRSAGRAIAAFRSSRPARGPTAFYAWAIASSGRRCWPPDTRRRPGRNRAPPAHPRRGHADLAASTPGTVAWSGTHRHDTRRAASLLAARHVACGKTPPTTTRPSSGTRAPELVPLLRERFSPAVVAYWRVRRRAARRRGVLEVAATEAAASVVLQGDGGVTLDANDWRGSTGAGSSRRATGDRAWPRGSVGADTSIRCSNSCRGLDVKRRSCCLRHQPRSQLAASRSVSV